MTETPVLTLGPLALLRFVGQGGMGEVWLAEHRSQRQPVAVKVINPRLAGSASSLRDFRREVRAMARLDHPGVIEVFDVGALPRGADAASDGALRPGSPYYVMEWVDGGSLADAGAPSDFGGLQQLLLQLLDALAHAHARGVVHRDIKPGNVLREVKTAEVRYLLTDFGIAQAIDALPNTASVERNPRGTALYMAPEQIHGDLRDQGPWTDLYALGCVAWECVTGATPFVGQTVLEVLLQHLQAPLPAFAPRFPVPDGFYELLVSLLAKEAAQRQGHAADVASWLRRMDAPAPPLQRGAPLALSDARTLLNAQLAPTPTSEQPALAEIPIAPSGASPRWPRALDEGFPEVWQEPWVRSPSTRLMGVGLHLVGIRHPPFVAREEERDVLWSALRAVYAEGRSRAVVLNGSPGVGKSRLMAWFVERVEALGVATGLLASHSQLGGPHDGLPGALTRLLRLGQRARDDEEQIQQSLRTLTGGELTAPQLASMVAFLRPALVASASAPPPDRTFYGQEQLVSPRERVALLHRLLGLLTARRPVLLVLDDVHYGAEGVALAQHLLELPAEEQLPILIVAASRGEALAARPFEGRLVGRLLEHPCASRLELRALPEDAMRRLIAALLVLDRGIAEQISARAAGNPLFAVALIQDCVQRGVLEHGEHGFQLHHDACLVLPDDLHVVVSDALDQLLMRRPRHARADDLLALELAAVGGAAILSDEWRRAAALASLRLDESLVDLLAEAEVAQRFELGWMFASPVLRESLERRAQRDGRYAAWHAAWADALEPNAGRLGVAWRIGAHRVQAGQLAQALEPLNRATMEATTSAGFEAAESLLDYRATLFDQLQIAPHDPRRLDLALDRARLRLERGFVGDAFAILKPLTVHAVVHENPRLLADALDVLGWTQLHQGALQDGLKNIEAGLELARLHDGEVVAQRLRSWARALLRNDLPEDALPALHEAVRGFRAQQRPVDAAATLTDLGRAYASLGQLEIASRCLADALTLCEAAGDRLAVGEAHLALGDVLRRLQEAERAAWHYAQAQGHLAAVGSNEAARAQVEQGLLAVEQGRCAEGFNLLDAALPDALASGMSDLIAAVQVGLLVAAAALDDRLAFDLMLSALARSAGIVAAEPRARALVQLAAQHARARAQDERASRAEALLAR